MANQMIAAQKLAGVFLDKWQNDPVFPTLVKKDPQAALKSCGIAEPWPELVKAFKGVDADTPVEELQRRINKGSMN